MKIVRLYIQIVEGDDIGLRIGVIFLIVVGTDIIGLPFICVTEVYTGDDGIICVTIAPCIYE